jgi:trk system potassium uptake protein TrkA
MKIVIAGAGDIGFHLAKLLALEQQDIILIDTNQEVLDYVATHLDVSIIKGDSSSVSILNEAGVKNANLFLAVTTSEKNNLITAILAKKLGAKQTIARVNSREYLSEITKGHFAELGVDSLISPRQLAAQEIARLIRQVSLTDIFDFEKGKISVIGFMLDESSPLVDQTIREIDDNNPDVPFKPIAILRNHQTIIPRGDIKLHGKDHIYCITKNDTIDDVVKFVGKDLVRVKNIMIVGGTDVGQITAQLLEEEYNVTLVDKSKETCKQLAENLNNTLIIKADPGNVELLKEEGLKNMDAFIALTPNSETNIITSLMAEDAGVFKTIALVDNTDYTHISQNIGIDTIINKKLIAANNIFRFVRKGKVEAITSLHGVNAEIIEFVIQKNNRITKNELKDLHFPKKALIAGVIRGEESLIPDGNFQLQLHDKVIVFALPEAISKVEELFR